MSKTNTPQLINEPDFLAEGFYRIDDNVLEKRAPKITLLRGFYKKSHEGQIEYLLKLSSTMNHAAYLLQEERNKLGELIEKKEEQLIAMNVALRQNSDMLQQEVTRINLQRQQYQSNVIELNKRIKELENGDNS